jgi:hypothetical protein
MKEIKYYKTKTHGRKESTNSKKLRAEKYDCRD